MRLHWCLRLATDAANPVVTGDDAVIVEGKVPTLEAALGDQRTLCFFPVCWLACLIGSPSKFDVETDIFHASDLKAVRSLYLKAEGCRFAYAPTRLAL
jgi:hypothetical protein